jgi:hypothetical protein
MHPDVCTSQHALSHLTLIPVARSHEGHQPEDVWSLEG